MHFTENNIIVRDFNLDQAEKMLRTVSAIVTIQVI